MKRKFSYWLLTAAILFLNANSTDAQQILQPGFNVKEYREFIQCDEYLYAEDAARGQYPLPSGFVKYYESPEVGLHNKITFWIKDNNVALICIRGTVAEANSWLENFYSAMIPATGALQINDSTIFNYKLAQDSLAYVHVGWTLGLSFLAPIAVKEINELHAKGIRNFIVAGHSQGGALSFLMRSYLQYSNEIPKDIFIKTYCSAPPKPGNLNYAYDFDHVNNGGWAYRIANTMDWVPETPLSVQTVHDMNMLNPIIHKNMMTGKQSFFQKLAVNYAYNKMSNASRKTMKRYQKYLGKYVYKQIKKSLPQFVQPKYAPSNNYMTAGSPVILQPDERYHTLFPQNPKTIFVNHSYTAYKYLLQLNFPGQ